MDTPDSTSRPSALRTALRRLVLGAFVCTAMVIVVLVGVAVFSATGLSTDPHGYGMFAGILFAAVLSPVALALWLLYRSMRRRGG
ncbi:hypothetical protein ALI144C_36865 [Actinosynnema sp. ALI-1.44]|uniref:hypothetical protein n=1 Tax=Actinosynnema sp. ALI-1.44 TaxID=1933779 RepID=UPI00097C2A23|nr:hypothetical protein [Actinosynnema sp. ALI-1.44]ONI76241.1 hypothetical protein ALI144C_36865 [Actinosynnema sp. ALI-1.44]